MSLEKVNKIEIFVLIKNIFGAQLCGGESSDDLLNESSRFELIEFGINSVSTHAVYRFSLEILIFIQREKRVGFRLNILTQGNIKKEYGENRK